MFFTVNEAFETLEFMKKSLSDLDAKFKKEKLKKFYL